MGMVVVLWQRLGTKPLASEMEVFGEQTLGTDTVSGSGMFDGFEPFDHGGGDEMCSMADNMFDLLGSNGYGDICNEESHEDGSSSRTTATKTTTTMEDVRARDRKWTLVSERKRRSRMKQMLYELRSLVPNITKMDKASIVGDAVTYMKALQAEKEELFGEIAMLESSVDNGRRLRVPVENLEAVGEVEGTSELVRGKILDLTTSVVGARRFQVRLECNKGDRIPATLYAAVESLEFLQMESSIFTTTADRHVLVISLQIGDCEQEMNAETLRLWVMGALLHEGFELETIRT